MERLRRGWTLQQVSDLTRISITVLRLLEEKNFEKIGAQRLVEMLLRTYSNALEEEGQSFKPFSEKGPRLESGHRQIDGRKLRSGSYLPFIMATGLLIVLIAGAGLLYRETKIMSSCKPVPESRTDKGIEQPKIEQSNVAPGAAEKTGASPDTEGLIVDAAQKELPADSVKKEPVQNEALPAPVAAPAPAQEPYALATLPGLEAARSPATADTRPTEASHLLEMHTIQKAWVQVTIDGKKPESELLDPGATRKWTALKRIEMVIGNRGGVQLEWDGKPVGLGDGKCRVVTVSLSDSGIVVK
jgi:cytoskeletal protein RodZ